jgi:hypothetical protein
MVLVATTFIDKVGRRAVLILALLLGIGASTAALLLQGQGGYLVGVAVAIGFWSLWGSH